MSQQINIQADYLFLPHLLKQVTQRRTNMIIHKEVFAQAIVLVGHSNDIGAKP